MSFYCLALRVSLKETRFLLFFIILVTCVTIPLKDVEDLHMVAKDALFDAARAATVHWMLRGVLARGGVAVVDDPVPVLHDEVLAWSVQ